MRLVGDGAMRWLSRPGLTVLTAIGRFTDRLRFFFACLQANLAFPELPQDCKTGLFVLLQPLFYTVSDKNLKNSSGFCRKTYYV
jgi:hypothetical protein